MKEKQNRNSTLQKMLVVTQLVEQAGRCHIRRERHTTPAKNRSYGQQGYHGAGGTKAQSDSKKKTLHTPCAGYGTGAAVASSVLALVLFK